MANVAPGFEFRQGRRLDDMAINQMLLEGQREIRPSEFEGIVSSSIGSMQHIGLTRAIVDPKGIRQWFIGKVVDAGPNGEPDWDGAHYWVREMRESTSDDTEIHAVPTFRLLQDIFDDLYPGDESSPPRWVGALNLGERNPDDPESESHTLVFGSTPLVRVIELHSSDGTPRWYFDRGAAAGTRFGVVRDIPDGNDNHLGVQAVQYDDNDVPQFVGDVVTLRTWPRIPARHYAPFLWPPQPPPDPVHPEVNVLPVSLVDGKWHVWQQLRWSFPPLPDVEWPISDCNPVLPP